MGAKLEPVSEETHDSLPRIREMVEAIVSGMGLELVDIEVIGTRRPRVCIFVDGTDGVTVDHCARISKALSAQIDDECEEELFEGAYSLEVSSPGLDREFKSSDDYRRNVGRRVQAQYREARPGGVETLIGLLEGFDEQGFELTLDGGERVRCSYEEIRRIHRSIEI
jgi:ribosome maturation factor RimP